MVPLGAKKRHFGTRSRNLGARSPSRVRAAATPRHNSFVEAVAKFAGI
jgi:hypothetical protein